MTQRPNYKSKTRVTESASSRPNSIGLGERELAQFVGEMSGRDVPDAVKRRQYVRWPYPKSVAVGIRHGSRGDMIAMAMACRNISSGGMSLLHRAFIHNGSGIRICLKKLSGEIVGIDGVVVHSRHVRGTTHEVGVRFDNPIDPREFLSLSSFASSFLIEHVEPDDLKGVVLAIDDSEADLRLLQHFLQGTQIRFRTASDIDEGAKLAAEGCDVILCDYHIGEQNGTEFIERLRLSGFDTPVLMMTADTQVTKGLLNTPADAILAKPISRELLHRALAQFLLNCDHGVAKKSTLSKEHPNSSFIPDFIAELRKVADHLEETIKTEDYTRCSDLCHQIIESSPTLGFQALADMASKTVRLLSSSMSVSEAITPVRRLITVCREAEG